MIIFKRNEAKLNLNFIFTIDMINSSADYGFAHGM
jgi:hypothetical protein